jgi:hypothetical protein
MTDYDSLVRDAVARETAATATPDYGLLAVRARHHRIRRVSVAAVGVAASVAVVALMTPIGSGGGDGGDGGAASSTATKAFDRIVDDYRAQVNVRLCLQGAGFDFGQNGLPGLPGSTNTSGDAEFQKMYTACLADQGYQSPAPREPDVQGRCDGVVTPDELGSDVIGSGVAGGRPWRVLASATDDAYCAGHTYGDSGVTGLVGGLDGGNAERPKVEPLDGTSYVLVYGFADMNVAHVAVEVAGTELQRAPLVAFGPIPWKRTYAFTLWFTGDVSDLSFVYYDDKGQVLRRLGGR